MKTFSRFSLVLASTLALSLATTACSGTAAPTAQSAAATTRAPVAQGTHGIVKLAGAALGDVDLRPEQRTELEKLAVSSEARHAQLRTDLRAVMLDIADQIERGSIDKGSLKAKIDDAIAKIDKVRPDDQASLAKLHEILDDGQRAQFVDAFRERGKERVEAAHQGGHPLMTLARDLNLTSEQRDKIREAFRDGMHEARGESGAHAWTGGGHGRGNGNAMLEAFKEPTFDPKTVGPQGSLAERAKGKEEAAFGVAEKILPILSAEQRKTLANKIRARANTEDPSDPF
jgi:Spy/CpxP family protein refolding chaperone